jgi:hypothetical protein
MFEVHKRYVFDRNGQAIAVQVPLSQFEKVEELAKRSGEVVFMLDQETQESSLLEESPEPEADKDPFEYVNGVLVLKAGSIDPESVESAIQRDREDRMRKLMSW